jgi:hypothetical protein
MLESDADRLAEIQALGAGSTLNHEGRCFDVIFDNEFVLAGDVEERAPVATIRSSDFACAEFQKEAVVEVFNPFDGTKRTYRLRRYEHDGTGMTRLILGAA